jgi:hypothetical protein
VFFFSCVFFLNLILSTKKATFAFVQFEDTEQALRLTADASVDWNLFGRPIRFKLNADITRKSPLLDRLDLAAPSTSAYERSELGHTSNNSDPDSPPTHQQQHQQQHHQHHQQQTQQPQLQSQAQPVVIGVQKLQVTDCRSCNSPNFVGFRFCQNCGIPSFNQ